MWQRVEIYDFPVKALQSKGCNDAHFFLSLVAPEFIVMTTCDDEDAIMTTLGFQWKLLVVDVKIHIDVFN